MSTARHTHRLLVAALVVVGALALSACSDSQSSGGGDEPATVEPVKGTDVSRVTLTPEAAKRLGIETAAVRRHGADEMTVPYGAVVYNADGTTFTYTSPKPRVFVRAPIIVERIEGGEAILLKGPPAGTQVVTTGSQELYGSEYEVEED
jgi:hypothetical protein